MRACVCVALVVVSTATPLAAQDSTAGGAPGQLCFRARPKPACSAFLLTNFGYYLVLGRNQSGGPPLRGVLDYGFMINITTGDAIGASVFASLGWDAFGVGPAARYRRWIPPSGSFEVAVGTSLVSFPNMETSSVLGLVKWSPNHWFAVAVRPELVRPPVYSEVQSRGRVSLGMEVGSVPGLVLTAASGVALLAIAALSAPAYR